MQPSETSAKVDLQVFEQTGAEPIMWKAALLKTQAELIKWIGQSRSHDKIFVVQRPEDADNLLLRLLIGLKSDKVQKDFVCMAELVTNLMQKGSLRIAFGSTRIRPQVIHPSSGGDIILLESGARGMNKDARSEMLARDFIAQCRSVLTVARHG